MLAMAIIVVGIFSRIIWHVPNFTPVLALALFGGMYLEKKQALYIPVALMIISDVIIGMHGMVAFTWGSVFLIALLGTRVREYRNGFTVLLAGVLSAVLFFVVTNFGVWLIYYPKSWDGFLHCYYLAVPFFRMTFSSTVLYSLAFYGVYELIAIFVKNTRWAKLLLAS